MSDLHALHPVVTNKGYYSTIEQIASFNQKVAVIDIDTSIKGWRHRNVFFFTVIS